MQRWWSLLFLQLLASFKISFEMRSKAKIWRKIIWASSRFQRSMKDSRFFFLKFIISAFRFHSNIQWNRAKTKPNEKLADGSRREKIHKWIRMLAYRYTGTHMAVGCARLLNCFFFLLRFISFAVFPSRSLSIFLTGYVCYYCLCIFECMHMLVRPRAAFTRWLPVGFGEHSTPSCDYNTNSAVDMCVCFGWGIWFVQLVRTWNGAHFCILFAWSIMPWITMPSYFHSFVIYKVSIYISTRKTAGDLRGQCRHQTYFRSTRCY